MANPASILSMIKAKEIIDSGKLGAIYYLTATRTHLGLVREDVNVFVWFSTFQDSAAYENYVTALSQSERWRGEVSVGLTRYFDRAPEVLKLSPTARSQLRS